MKVKVLRIIARLNVGGPAIHVVNLNSGMDRARFDSVLVTGIENAGEGSLLDYAHDHQIQPLQISEMVGEASIKPRDAIAFKRLYDLIRTERPHVVHTHTAKAGVLGRLAAKAARVPVIVHTYHGHVLRGYFPPMKSRFLTLMERALASVSDCLVAVSEETKTDLVDLGVTRSEKVRVIPLGFHLQPFLDCKRRRRHFANELRVEDHHRIVGIVGRLFPIKNHRLFLEAAALVRKRFPDASFVIVGDGILREDLERYAAELEISSHVFFTGWRRDLPNIYSDIDVLVVSSNNEGTPVAAIEALATGCPVVATRVGGLPALVEDGTNGYLVAPNDPGALAARIQQVLSEPDTANRMGQEGRKMVANRFAANRLVRETEDLYEELLLEKGALPQGWVARRTDKGQEFTLR